MMIWPQATDYHAAMQNPAACFVDDDLRGGVAVSDVFGLPRPHSGNFADVYQVRAASGQSWAVKCFTRPVQHLQARYQAVSESLAQHRLPFLVDFHYLPQGICLDDQWFPLLKMRWVEGLQLNAIVADNLDRPQVLDRLAQMWLRLAQELRKAEMAHGDLQHGNVLLVPGSKPGSLSLRLIDYDGMLVPRLGDQPSGEVGHPHYQHPERLRNGTYNADMDRFSHLVIFTALRCLRLGGRKLWQQYDNAENLLFREADFRAPQNSRLWQELWALDDNAVCCLVGRLLLASQGPMEGTPLLEPHLGGDVVEPLTWLELREIRSLLGLPSLRIVPCPPIQEGVTTTADSQEMLVPPEGENRPGHVLPPPLPPIEWLATATVLDQSLGLADEGTHRLPPMSPVDAAATATLPPKVTVLERPTRPLPFKPTLAAPSPRAGQPQISPPKRTTQVFPNDPWVPLLLGSTLLALSFLILVTLWIKNHPTSQAPPKLEPEPLPRLTTTDSQMGLLSGDKRSFSIRVDRQNCTAPLRVRFEELPVGVFLSRTDGGPPLYQRIEWRDGQHSRVVIPEVSLAGHQDQLDLEINTKVRAYVNDKVVKVTLWLEEKKADEKELLLKVTQRNLPSLRPVLPIWVKIGETATLPYDVDWQYSREDVEVKLVDLPEGISCNPVLLKNGEKPQPLQVVASSEIPDMRFKHVDGQITAQLTLLVRGEQIDHQPVDLTVAIRKPAPNQQVPEGPKLNLPRSTPSVTGQVGQD